MITVHKYAVKTAQNTVKMPRGAIILSAKNQNEELVLYAQVDTDAQMVDRRICCLATGEPMHSSLMTFIDTVLLENDQFVCHVFDRGEK